MLGGRDSGPARNVFHVFMIGLMTLRAVYDCVTVALGDTGDF